MSRLSKLYQAMEPLASEGLELSAEQEAQRQRLPQPHRKRVRSVGQSKKAKL